MTHDGNEYRDAPSEREYTCTVGRVKSITNVNSASRFTLARIIYESSDGSNTSDLGMLNW